MASASRKSAPRLPDAPPAVCRPRVDAGWTEGWEGILGAKIGTPKADGLTAKVLVDHNYRRAGRTCLIYTAKKFWEWNGSAWGAADLDKLEGQAWALLKGARNERRVKAVLYALKFEVVWPPLPAARAA